MIYSKLVDKQFIDKGWSGDKKYCAKTADGTKYLLRITPKEKSDKHQDMFRMQQKCAELGIPMCLPVEIGECEEGIYTIQTWIDGEDAEDVIATLPKEKQYKFGYDAGVILKQIHSIPAPADQPDWEPRFNHKMDRKIQMYRDCPIKFEGAEEKPKKTLISKLMYRCSSVAQKIRLPRWRYLYPNRIDISG